MNASSDILNLSTNNIVKALLSEYALSIAHFVDVISNIPASKLAMVVDSTTKDPDCVSIQSVLSHVVESGYTYVIEIRKWLGEELAYKQKENLYSIEDYIMALDKMFEYNIQLFRDYPDVELETYSASGKIKVRWGQIYDVEQLYEHAILHILRHRRQIEKFMAKL
ncbi:MAG: DinB family protein [Crocinitomicaceae bacterium]